MTVKVKQRSDLEHKMLEKGYASANHVAEKISRHIATVHRMIKDEKLRTIRVGDQMFVEIASVQEHMGADAIDLLELNDWG